MLNDCYNYSEVINAKGLPFPAEPVIIALIFPELTNRMAGTTNSQTTLSR
jgi:hypothetical protein